MDGDFDLVNTKCHSKTLNGFAGHSELVVYEKLGSQPGEITKQTKQ